MKITYNRVTLRPKNTYKLNIKTIYINNILKLRAKYSTRDTLEVFLIKLIFLSFKKTLNSSNTTIFKIFKKFFLTLRSRARIMPDKVNQYYNFKNVILYICIKNS